MNILGKKEISVKYQELNEVHNKLIDITYDTQRVCVEFLKSLIDANGGEINGEMLDGCYVAYDGGNHPEYASTMSSDVERIYVEDGTLYFEIEDSPKYSIDRIMVNDLVYVCEDIMNNIKNIEGNE